ncbi:MAG: hypothetical protein WCB68_05510 [Pyrinomonadaceae bacterium]
MRSNLINMRRLTAFLSFAFIFALVAASSAAAQTQAFTNDSIEYALDLPSATWRAIAQPDGVHRHAEFIYGDRSDGLLRIRKEVVEAGTTPKDLARFDQEQKLHYLPGYVEGKEESFTGRLNGVTISYEYTEAGKAMVGRTYYLQADNRTIYTLRFTGLRDKLARIRNQTDLIARSFHLK